MAVKTIKPTKAVKASTTRPAEKEVRPFLVPLTAKANDAHKLLNRISWGNAQTPPALMKYFQKHTGAKVQSMKIGMGPAKGAFRVDLGSIDEAARVWFLYMPKDLKNSGFVITPSTSMNGYYAIMADAAQSFTGLDVNLLDLGPLIQTERALKFLSVATASIEKVAVKLLGVMPAVIAGVEDLMKQVAQEEAQASKDVGASMEKYNKP